MVTFLKKTTAAANAICIHQNRMNQKVLSLIQECSTRWWSILIMIYRILEIQEPLNAILGQKHKAGLILSPYDLERQQAVANLMARFQTFATMLGGDHYVTMSYLKEMLVKINEHIKDTTDDSQMIKGMKQAMRENLSIIYQSEAQKIMIIITSMLEV